MVVGGTVDGGKVGMDDTGCRVGSFEVTLTGAFVVSITSTGKGVIGNTGAPVTRRVNTEGSTDGNGDDMKSEGKTLGAIDS